MTAHVDGPVQLAGTTANRNYPTKLRLTWAMRPSPNFLHKYVDAQCRPFKSFDGDSYVGFHLQMAVFGHFHRENTVAYQPSDHPLLKIQ